MNKLINWLRKFFGIKAKPAKVEVKVEVVEAKVEEPKHEHVEVKEEVKVEKAE
jgi:hypothetical protein